MRASSTLLASDFGITYLQCITKYFISFTETLLKALSVPGNVYSEPLAAKINTASTNAIHASSVSAFIKVSATHKLA